LNFGLSPDFSVQLKVSLSESLSERLSQKSKRPSVLTDSNETLQWTMLHAAFSLSPSTFLSWTTLLRPVFNSHSIPSGSGDRRRAN